MKFVRLTRVTWLVGAYRDAIVWLNFDLIAGMSNASAAEGGGAFLKFAVADTSSIPGPAPRGSSMFNARSADAPVAGDDVHPIYVALTRYVPSVPPPGNAFSNGFNEGFL